MFICLKNVQDILTLKECQQVLKVGRNTMLNLIYDGSIEAFKIGNRWKIPKESLIQYLRNVWWKFLNLHPVSLTYLWRSGGYAGRNTRTSGIIHEHFFRCNTPRCIGICIPSGRASAGRWSAALWIIHKWPQRFPRRERRLSPDKYQHKFCQK